MQPSHSITNTAQGTWECECGLDYADEATANSHAIAANKYDPPKLPKVVQKRMNGLELKMDQITRTPSIFNANQVAKIFSSTPARYQYTRPGKGGGNWDYVKSSYVRRALDSLFGFNWDLEIETTVSEAFEVAKVTGTCVVKGVLTGRTKVGTEWVAVRKTQFGRSEVKFKSGTKDPLDFGNDMKGACSDALKKCASLLGIAADVYESGEFREISIVGSDAESAQTKNMNNKIAAAQDVLSQDSQKVE